MSRKVLKLRQPSKRKDTDILPAPPLDFPVSLEPESISIKHDSKSSDSFGMKKKAELFAFTGLGKHPDKKHPDKNPNAIFLDNDMISLVLKNIENELRLPLLYEILEIYPFEDVIYTKYAEYLALNPSIHQLIPKLIEKIKDNQAKLSKFYLNLAKNTNKKVISYLEKEYDDDHDSKNLNWYALCNNPKAIKIVEKEYVSDHDSENLNWIALCNNPKAIKIVEKEYDRDKKNFYNKLSIIELYYLCRNPKAIEILKDIYRDRKKLDWDGLCENPKAIGIITEEYVKVPNSTNIKWNALCGNPKAINIIIREYNKNSYPTKLNWEILCGNPKAIKILKREHMNINSKNIKWKALCGNPKAIGIITEEYKKDPNSINWEALCGNPEAIGIITEEYKKDPNSINWEALCGNPKAIGIITEEYKKDPNSINWKALCRNPEAIGIIAEEYRRGNDSTNINWEVLSGNTNPEAIKLLDKEDIRDSVNGTGTHLLNWHLLSSNPNAINMIIRRLRLEKTEKKKDSNWKSYYNPRPLGYIKWEHLLQNPSIFYN
jgi:hypothetical protein